MGASLTPNTHPCLPSLSWLGSLPHRNVYPRSLAPLCKVMVEFFINLLKRFYFFVTNFLFFVTVSYSCEKGKRFGTCHSSLAFRRSRTVFFWRVEIRSSMYRVFMGLS